MAFASLSDADDNDALAEIDMVPLIDVMLVLLVIFIVTAPLLTHAVKVDLPKASSAPNLTQPDNVQVASARLSAAPCIASISKTRATTRGWRCRCWRSKR